MLNLGMQCVGNVAQQLEFIVAVGTVNVNGPVDEVAQIAAVDVSKKLHAETYWASVIWVA
jgi:hypothetical protein